MRRIPVVIALGTAFVLISNAPPATAQYGAGASVPGQSRAVAASKTKKKNVAARQSPSGNPDWDVYVRGEYVGSDPDPRIRATIRREAVRNYGMR
jgi:hypothetical protein